MKPVRAETVVFLLLAVAVLSLAVLVRWGLLGVRW